MLFSQLWGECAADYPREESIDMNACVALPNGRVPKFALTLQILLVVVAFGVAFPTLPGCSKNSSHEEFTNGGVTLMATTKLAGKSKVTAVTDQNGQDILSATFTAESVTFRFEGREGETVIPLPRALDELPSDFACHRAAIYVAGVVQSELNSQLRFDSPGCDWFPDSNCTLNCCALHDECYAQNHCSFTSFFPLVGSDACDNCNAIAIGCIMTGCSGVEDSAQDYRCYDHRCDEFYDCPELDDDATNCACQSPCDVPPNCGNGSCEVDEDVSNCAADCLFGAGLNQCCVDTGNCPTEEPYDCPGSCCCCGYGEVCGVSSLCENVSGNSLNLQAPKSRSSKRVPMTYQ